jgi:hypothetical protein
MKNHRIVQKVVFGILFGLLTLSLAQQAKLGGNLVQTFELRDVQERQGIITVSPDSFTVLQFENEIDAFFFRHSDLLRCINCRTEGNRIFPPDGGALILAAVKNVGYTDIVVTVGGVQTFFRAVVQSGSYSQLVYKVRSTPLATTPAPKGTPTAQPPSTNGTEPVQQALEGREVGTGGDLRLQAGVTPVWLKLQAIPEVSEKGTRILVTFENIGVGSASLDPIQLKLSKDGTPLEYDLQVNMPANFAGTLSAKGVYNAVLSVKGEVKGDVNLEWKIFDSFTKRTYTLTRKLNVALAVR